MPSYVRISTDFRNERNHVFPGYELRKDAYQARCGSIIALALNRGVSLGVQMICLPLTVTQYEALVAPFYSLRQR
jgi:hypothetical protein